jgi:hypothetical protein
MSVADIRTYVANTKRGDGATSDQRRLFEAHAARLHDEITRLRMRERYITAKARMWAARERGDTEAEQEIISTVIELGGRLLNDEGAQRG